MTVGSYCFLPSLTPPLSGPRSQFLPLSSVRADSRHRCHSIREVCVWGEGGEEARDLSATLAFLLLITMQIVSKVMTVGVHRARRGAVFLTKLTIELVIL